MLVLFLLVPILWRTLTDTKGMTKIRRDYSPGNTDLLAVFLLSAETPSECTHSFSSLGLTFIPPLSSHSPFASFCSFLLSLCFSLFPSISAPHLSLCNQTRARSFVYLEAGAEQRSQNLSAR